MNLPADRIRSQLMLARKFETGAKLDAKVAELLADAMVEARLTGGDATEAVMIGRFGFTRDELTKHGTAAKDAATARWVASNAVDVAA